MTDFNKDGEKMTNNAILITGIKSVMSNFNADEDGYPKKLNERYYASGGALTYLFRRYFQLQGHYVFGLADYEKTNKKDIWEVKTAKNKLVKNLEVDEKEKNAGVLLNKISKAIDIRLFGGVFGTPVNFGLQGAVQVQRGMNIYDDTTTRVDMVMSPNASAEKKAQTTLGANIFTDIAIYNYPISVQPNTYDVLNSGQDELLIQFNDSDYERLLSAAIYAPSQYKSNSKGNIETSYVVELILKEGELLPNGFGSDLISAKEITDENGYTKYELDMTRLQEFIDKRHDKFEKITLHLNTLAHTVKGWNGEVEEIL